MARFVLAALLTLAFSLTGSVALAGQPNNQACLGHDVAGRASQDGSALGAFFSGVAMSTQGLGDEVQAHQAGLIPDSVLPNSCND
jgi:hypothetical protein